MGKYPELLSDEALEARREYWRKWRREHPDRIRQYNRTYWEKQAKIKAEQEANKDGK